MLYEHLKIPLRKTIHQILILCIDWFLICFIVSKLYIHHTFHNYRLKDTTQDMNLNLKQIPVVKLLLC